jgi:hypothetical protein
MFVVGALALGEISIRMEMGHRKHGIPHLF